MLWLVSRQGRTLDGFKLFLYSLAPPWALKGDHIILTTTRRFIRGIYILCTSTCVSSAGTIIRLCRSRDDLGHEQIRKGFVLASAVRVRYGSGVRGRSDRYNTIRTAVTGGFGKTDLRIAEANQLASSIENT